jgi:hypothetical protein
VADDRSAPAAAGEELPQELPASEGEAVGTERTGSESEAGESVERRPKRRRSRRGRKRRTTEADVGAADKPAETFTSLASEESSEVQPEVVDSDMSADEPIGLEEGEEGEEGDDQRSPRLGFRGIPTWEEVVGLIVNKNIETRAKRPGGGTPRGRGHRGPRDAGGGRGGKRRSS